MTRWSRAKQLPPEPAGSSSLSCTSREHVPASSRAGAGGTDFQHQIRRFSLKRHPTGKFAVAELMRLLMDEQRRGLRTPPGQITTGQHQLQQSHPVTRGAGKPGRDLFERLLPPPTGDHLRNQQRFLRMVSHPLPRPTGLAGEDARFRRAVQAQGAHGPTWRWWGSHHVKRGGELQQPNWCAASCSPRSPRLWPERFTNVTNLGVHAQALIGRGQPPSLPCLLDEAIAATAAVTGELQRLGIVSATTPSFLRARCIRARPGQTAPGEHHSIRTWGCWWNPSSRCSMFAKGEADPRITSATHLAARRSRALPSACATVRICRRATFIFGGQGGPAATAMAKLKIRLHQRIAETSSTLDPAMDAGCGVVFLPNLSVAPAYRPEGVIKRRPFRAGYQRPARRLRHRATWKIGPERGRSRSGTLNDGANCGNPRFCGHENFFLFGPHAESIEAINRNGYHPGCPGWRTTRSPARPST